MFGYNAFETTVVITGSIALAWAATRYFAVPLHSGPNKDWQETLYGARPGQERMQEALRLLGGIRYSKMLCGEIADFKRYKLDEACSKIFSDYGGERWIIDAEYIWHFATDNICDSFVSTAIVCRNSDEITIYPLSRNEEQVARMNKINVAVVAHRIPFCAEIAHQIREAAETIATAGNIAERPFCDKYCMKP